MSKRSERRVRYAGELATPFRLQDHQNDDAAIEAFDNRLKTLASMHKIDLDSPDAGWNLAIALAQDHVPGLRITKGRVRGRKPTWLAGLGELLRREVDEIREQSNCNISRAIADLRADKSNRWRKHRPQTLAARHREARRRYRDASQRDRIALCLMANEVAKSD